MQCITVNAVRPAVPCCQGSFYGIIGRMKKKDLQKELKLFGANLRQQRIACNITQEKLAELASLNVRTIQKIEAGQTNILITTAKRLQKALGCPWKLLLG